MATRTFRGATDSNWGTAANWLENAVPTSADDAVFDAASPNCTVNASNRVCLTFNSTGYTNTITKTFRITVSGAITVGAGTQWAGSEYLTGQTAATHTSNGNVIDRLWLLGNLTHTLADTFSVSAALRLGSGASGTTVNTSGGSGFSVAGDLDFGQLTTGSAVGTAAIVMTGTGTLTPNNGTGRAENTLTFNTSGTITGAAGTLRYNAGTMTYTAGTVNMTATDLASGASTTFNLGSSVHWKSYTVTGASTITNNADFYCDGLASIGAGTSAVTLNGNKLYVAGGLKNAGTTNSISGTTEIVLSGTGTVSSSSTGFMSNKLTIDAGAGTVTLTDASTVALRIAAGQLKYLSGTVITDNGTWTTGGGSSGGGNLINSQALVRGIVL